MLMKRDLSDLQTPVRVVFPHAREMVMWFSRMFLIGSNCLKAEQLSTATPLHHI
jgi:hypothetical protein